jgi:dipeptidyl aminopeptidase/acylaminoacyl peptidase
VVSDLLDEGFYFCGVDVGESYGSPAGRAVFSKFHRLLVDRFGLSPKACLFPVSRGGLMHYNWGVEHPECVACIGGIYPVCSLASYPGIEKAAAEYGLTLEELKADLANHNPLDRLSPLAAAGVPLFHLQGDSDTVVPLEANSGELARRYKALGGKMELVVVPGKGHEIVPEFWEDPRLAEFFRRHANR